MVRSWFGKAFTIVGVVVLIGLMTVSAAGSLTGVNSGRRATGSVSIAVQGQGVERTELHYQVADFDWGAVSINGAPYRTVNLEGEARMLEKGCPDLPAVSRSIIVPDDARMTVRVTSSDYREYDDVLIAPSKGNLLRTIDPADVPYEFGDVYSRDAWYPEHVVELGEPYILRDIRGQVVTLHPFQYNPVRRQLRVYTDVTLEVVPNGPGDINVLDRDKPLTAIDHDFRGIYERHFLNYAPWTQEYTVGDEQGNMLVITYDNFWPVMESFVAWKNMKGIPTEMVRVSDIGNNANSIKNYIIDYYNTKGLAFVLLVGDIGQVTTFHFTYGYETGASDPTFSYIVGNDHYPDLFVGRFSAQDIQQVGTMVRRSVEYERYPLEGGAWYHKGTGIASNEGPGDDGEYDWQHIRNIRTDLMNYTYDQVDELYDGSHGGDDGAGNPPAAAVTSAVNAGRGVINYCGHGWELGWGTTGYDIYAVEGLTNDNMLPFIWSVACLNGAFDDVSTCFAEAWLRATHNGEPAGAVGAFMASINQSWDPPMDAQDEMDDILVRSYQDNQEWSFGGISFSGCMHMNDRYGGQGNQMTDTWHVFGDPSLEVRTDTPTSMTVDHEATISVGSNGFEVTVPGVEGALCALSRDSVYLGSGYTNGSGHAIVHLAAPLSDGADLDLVVTAYNRIPYEATVGVSATGAVIYVDDSYQQFLVMGGNWRTASNAGAWNNQGRFARGGVGSGSVGWGVTSAVTPGTYDVYAWKFEHNWMGLMAADAHYKVYYSTGQSDWILVDQSAPGDEWVYLGTFDFNNDSTQGVMLTNEANGIVIADAIRLVQTAP